MALRVVEDWYGIEDLEFAETVYARGAWIPREPYPCYEGIANTMRIHDSHEMRQYDVADFFDDSLLRELDDIGLIDNLY